jgi:hypothetical protein
LGGHKGIDIRLHRLVEFPYPTTDAGSVHFHSLQFQIFSYFSRRYSFEVEVDGVAYCSCTGFRIRKSGVESKSVIAITAEIDLNVACLLVMSNSPFGKGFASASLAYYLAELS